VSGCGGGDEPASRPTAKGSPSASATASPYGEPAVTGAAAAFAALRDYNRRNNQVIVKTNRAPYDFSLWKSVDSGALLATDRFATKAARNGYHVPDSRWRFGSPIRVYAPASRTWPKDLLVAAPTHYVSSHQSWVDRKSVSLVLLRQPSSGAPWISMGDGVAARSRLPQPAAPGSDPVPSAEERQQAADLAGRLATYWRDGTAPAGFADTRFVDEPRTTRATSLKSGEFRDVVYDATVLEGDDGVRVYRVDGGVIALAAYRLRVTWVAASGTRHWEDLAASVWGSASSARLTSTNLAFASFFVPTGGPAQPLGYRAQYAAF
jgi:hypothetical protein